MTLVEELAAWAAALRVGDVPAEVLELTRAQRAAVLGAGELEHLSLIHI